jgi:Domain of unknown function (DUF4192)
MTSTDRTVLVTTPADLIAALPYLLGFHPHESLVLVATHGRSGGSLGLTLRVDLPPPRHRRAVADAVAGKLMLGAPTGAAVIVVGAGPPQRTLVERVVAALERRRVAVHTAMWAESTAGGGRWGCYDPCACGGVLPDPATTVAVAAAVAGGQVALGDRGELERFVAPADEATVGRREALLIAAQERAAAAAGGEPDDLDDLVGVVDSALADSAAGRLVLDDDRVVALAMALAEPLVRDTVMARCAGSVGAPGSRAAAASGVTVDEARCLAAAAEQLWAALARETPDPEAAEPAALLAVSAMLRGHGALATVALDRAEQAWPGHRLTGLLRQATDAGMRPEAFRACLGLGDPGGVAAAVGAP